MIKIKFHPYYNYIFATFSVVLLLTTSTMLTGVNISPDDPPPAPSPCQGWVRPEMTQVQLIEPIKPIKSSKDSDVRAEVLLNPESLNAIAEAAWVDSYRIGFAPYQAGDSERYLNQTRSSTTTVKIDGKVCGSYNKRSSESYNLDNNTYSFIGDDKFLEGFNIIDSPTQKSPGNIDFNTIGNGVYTTSACSLSNPYTMSDFMKRTSEYKPYREVYSDTLERVLTDPMKLPRYGKYGDYFVSIRMFRYKYNWGNQVKTDARTSPPINVIYFQPDDRTLPKKVSRIDFWDNWRTDNQSPTYDVNPVDLEGAVNGNYTISRVGPGQLFVDGDRNGSLGSAFYDKTTAEKPFRFWINNDQDNVEVDEPATTGNTPDSSDSKILTKRDLEDFTRIQLSANVRLDDLKNGDWKVGLRFKGGQAPTIRIWPNESNTDSLDYLNKGDAAQRQIAMQSFGIVGGSTLFIPQSYWQRPDNTSSNANLIFEGISKGAGELALILKHKHSNREFETNSIHLKLLDVREMFTRARVRNSALDIPDPWINPTPPAQTVVSDDWHWPPVEDPDATPITAIFVHGWRLTYDEYLTWAQTSYKRLWHQGFKGRFYTFRWPTLSADQSDNDGLFTFNPSEYRAWLSGPALASWVNTLPNSGNRNLFAHSMGNVIAGEALRNGMMVRRYALCNAAVPSMAYDSSQILQMDPTTLQTWNKIWPPLEEPILLHTPDTDPSAIFRNRYGIRNRFNGGFFSPIEMFNFYLRDDSALSKRWVENNQLFKPQLTGQGYRYEQIPFTTPWQLAQGPPSRQVVFSPEALAYVTKALTRTLGQDPRTAGSIDYDIDMNDWGPHANHSGFGTTHSAQWRWSIQSTNEFWGTLFVSLRLRSP